MKLTKKILKELAREMPPLIARRKVSEFTGGSVAPHTLANADAMGTGPTGKIQVGRNVAYTRESLLAWLEARIDGEKSAK